MLALSTAHLPEGLLIELAHCFAVVAHPTEHGALLWVPDDPDDWATELGPIPEQILAVQRHARSLGCDYVLLDRDAPVIAPLPTWDW